MISVDYKFKSVVQVLVGFNKVHTIPQFTKMLFAPCIFFQYQKNINPFLVKSHVVCLNASLYFSLGSSEHNDLNHHNSHNHH